MPQRKQNFSLSSAFAGCPGVVEIWPQRSGWRENKLDCVPVRSPGEIRLKICILSQEFEHPVKAIPRGMKAMVSVQLDIHIGFKVAHALCN